MTKKSSGAAATATEKVAALVAPAGEQRRCAHHCIGAVADPENFDGGHDKNFKHKTSKIRMFCNQARSQKFAMEQLF